MKTMTTLALIGATALTLTAGAASAQGYRDHDDRYHGGRYESRYEDDWRFQRNGWRDDRGAWMNINQRQAMLERRIDRGLNNGQLTGREAWHLRNEFRQISRLEHRYRVNGLSGWERADLDRRFDALAMKIRFERRDAERRDGRTYGYSRY